MGHLNSVISLNYESVYKDPHEAGQFSPIRGRQNTLKIKKDRRVTDLKPAHGSLCKTYLKLSRELSANELVRKRTCPQDLSALDLSEIKPVCHQLI